MSEGQSPYRAIKIIRDLNVPGYKSCMAKQYPFDEMEVGHKFHIPRPIEELELSSNAPSYWKNKTMHNIQTHITLYRKKYPENKNKRFTLRYQLLEFEIVNGEKVYGKALNSDDDYIDGKTEFVVTCWRIDDRDAINSTIDEEE